MSKPIGLVLAGGRGLRMGRPKGDLLVEGQALALRAAQVLRPLCGGVLVSLRPGARNPAPGLAVVEDATAEGRGPLAGIHAGFEATDHADLLVLACDYPWVTTTLLRELLERSEPSADWVLMSDGEGRLHPLVGLWRRAVAEEVARALERGAYKVRAVTDSKRTLRLGPEQFPGLDLTRLLVNLNVRGDLDALTEFGPEPG